MITQQIVKLNVKEKIDLYRRVFGTIDGHKLLCHLIDCYKVLTPFMTTPSEFELGKKDTILEIINTLRINPSNLVEINENEWSNLYGNTN